MIIKASIVSIRLKVHFRLVHKVSLLDQLPRKEHDNHDGDLDVVRYKVDGLEMRTEAFPALHQDEEGVQAHGKDGPVGIRPVLEREQMLQTLGPDGTPETQRSQTDTDPGQLVGHTDNVLQPGPQLAGSDVTRSKAQPTDGRGRQHGNPGNSEAVQLAKESRRIPVHREGVQQTGSCKEGVVGGGDDRGHDHGVDEAGSDRTTRLLKNNREGTGAAVLLGKTRVIPGHVQSHDQDGKHVE